MSAIEESDIEESNGLFNITLEPLIKDFLNQQNRSALIMENQSITVQNPSEFKEKIWEVFQNQLKREVIIRDDGVLEMIETDPHIDSIDNFIRLRKNNRFMMPSAISLTSLRTIASSSAPISTIVCRYSFNLLSKAHWIQFQNKFILPLSQDRAGATSNEIVFDVLQRLRSRWSGEYQSESANWYSWAAFIVESDQYEQDGLIGRPPPPHLVQQFRPAPTSTTLALEQINTASNASLNILRDFKQQLDHLKQLYERRHEEYMLGHQEFLNCVGSLETTLRTYFNIIPEYETASRPNTVSANRYQERIPEQTDVDHQH
ncbi:hypothetical protein HK103_007352 [Boothiomyces macroporosus]|uniref:Uncharacterized protein n=1 Tax=Boothiomyces macroporosus TaxID=261099 RepID=A0AAD5UMW2_9FUNG|nr:hypothetical protein HK103_007352 [Boothiomyces macroporosus]